VTTVDPVTTAVIGSGLVATSDEMSEALRRSSYSPIIREMLDYSCAIFTDEGETVAQAENIPALLGAMSIALQALIADNAAGGFEPGDIFIANDPYRGGTHTPDIHIFTPVFVGDRLMAWSGSLAHHADIGGTNPGTEGFANRSIFEEGLRFPNIRLFEAGRPIEPLFRYIEANVRDPRATLGDLRAQVAAVKLGATRVRSLAARHGDAVLAAAMRALLDGGEARMRASILEHRDGRAEAVGYLDSGGVGDDPVRICVAVEVHGDRVEADFTGTDPQVAGGLNCSRTAVMAGVLFAVKAIFDADGTQNGGCARPIDVVLPEGTVVNPRYPAALSLRHLTAQRIADTLIRAFAQLYPEDAAAGSFVGFSSLAAEGVHPRTGLPTVPQDDLGGGMGGHPGGDGLDAVDTYLGNVGILPAEICELQYPLRIVSTELLPDSCGPGRHRGGLGMRRIYEFLGPCDLVAYSEQTVRAFAPWGADGGEDGTPASVVLRRTTGEEIAITKTRLLASAGDRLVLTTGGGGGYGPASERPRSWIERDIREGKVTPAAARERYGWTEVGLGGRDPAADDVIEEPRRAQG
jgi:N-methylhydantoinase B